MYLRGHISFIVTKILMYRIKDVYKYHASFLYLTNEEAFKNNFYYRFLFQVFDKRKRHNEATIPPFKL